MLEVREILLGYDGEASAKVAAWLGYLARG
jgi:hypothetical protein